MKTPNRIECNSPARACAKCSRTHLGAPSFVVNQSDNVPTDSYDGAGVNQMGEVHARCWIVVGCSELGGTCSFAAQ
jgi:hypothetical protein